jgi:hypothetical protein
MWLEVVLCVVTNDGQISLFPEDIGLAVAALLK